MHPHRIRKGGGTMYYGSATFEEGKNTRTVKTKLCATIEAVCHEIAKLCRDGRIASCDIMVKLRGKSYVVKSVTL